MVGIAVDITEAETLDSNTILLQTGFWGRFKSMFGWKAYPLLLRFETGEIDKKHRVVSLKLLLLTRRVGKLISFGYVPFGPDGSLIRSQGDKSIEPGNFLTEISGAISDFLLEHEGERLSFIRYDLPWGYSVGQPSERALYSGLLCFDSVNLNPGERDSVLFALSSIPRVQFGSGMIVLRKSPVDIQPPSTVILSIDGEEDEILGAMKSKTRYNIRLSMKRGVKVREGGIEDIPLWYDMYSETAKRDRIAIHSRVYYESLFKLAEGYGDDAPDLRLLLAEVDGEVVAGNIMAIKGEAAWYLYGASTNRYRNLMPTYALQWQSILTARANGCRYYDLFGIPPEGDPSHPMYGLYRFKTGFGGTIFHRFGCYDAVLDTSSYFVYCFIERLRNGFFKKVKKLGRNGKG